MAYDSVMDISLQLNIDDISGLAAEDMELSLAQTPLPESMALSKSCAVDPILNDEPTPRKQPDLRPQLPPEGFAALNQPFSKFQIRGQNDINLTNLKSTFATLPDIKAILLKNQGMILAACEKQQQTEAELATFEIKIAAKKKAQSEYVTKLEAMEEESRKLQAKLSEVENHIHLMEKEMARLTKEKVSSDKENAADKSKVDLYRQLTGVTFAKLNPNTPSLLKGYASAPTARTSNNSSSSDLKTFSFNTSEHSTTLVRDFLWQVLEEMHESSWVNVGRPALCVAEPPS